MNFGSFEIKSKKLKIEREIYDYEDAKSQKMLELGMMTYEKIRNGQLDESLFKDICGDIRKLDLEIYNRMLDISALEGHESIPICDCGYVVKNNEKFCPSCGSQINRDKNLILCDVCASKINSDSNYCVCCGAKVLKNKYDSYDVEEDSEDIDDINYDVIEDSKGIDDGYDVEEDSEDTDDINYDVIEDSKSIDDILSNVENYEAADNIEEKINVNLKKQVLNEDLISDKIDINSDNNHENLFNQDYQKDMRNDLN